MLLVAMHTGKPRVGSDGSSTHGRVMAFNERFTAGTVEGAAGART